MSMNDRVSAAVHENARAFYEGIKSSVEAFCAIDTVSASAWNHYPGVLNDTRELFDRLLESYVCEDVDEKRMLNYAAKEMVDQLRRGTQPDEDFFRVQVTGNGATRWVNITPAQLRSFAMVLDTDAPPSAFEV